MRSVRYVMVSLFAVGIPPISVVTGVGGVWQWRVGQRPTVVVLGEHTAQVGQSLGGG